MQQARVFVDFWNFHLSVRAMSRLPLRVNWQMFGLRAVQTLSPLMLGNSPRCEGTHIYGSYSTSEQWQAQLAKEMVEKHALIPGVFPIFEKREKQASIRNCGSCGEPITLNAELGIDVRLAIDVVKFSHFNQDEVILLATNDSDFIPLVEYLTSLGRKVVHLHPKNANTKLSRVCWANWPLEKIDRDALPYEDASIIIRLKNDDACAPLEAHLTERAIPFTVLDLTGSKLTDYELYRIFADNQNYHTNFLETPGGFEQYDPGNHLSDIESAIRLARKRPDLLHGPFFLHGGKVLNRTGVANLMEAR
jgi:hypothetical protein